MVTLRIPIILISISSTWFELQDASIADNKHQYPQCWVPIETYGAGGHPQERDSSEPHKNDNIRLTKTQICLAVVGFRNDEGRTCLRVTI
jgi:hypothetical protein